jgi:hypothetical protein
MAQPDLKSASAAIVVGYLGAALGEFSFILMGGMIGGVIAVELDERSGSFWRALRVMGIGVGVALVFGGAVASVAPNVAPEAWGLSPDILWAPVAAALAAFWQHGARAIVAALKRLGGGKK